MHVRAPVWLRRAGTPQSFAVLFALESFARALLASLIPIQAYGLLGSAQKVSVLFFAVSLCGLAANLAVPWLVRHSARRWIYSAGTLLLFSAPLALAQGTLPGQIAGMALRVLGVVAMTVCLSLYIMDHVERRDLTRSEPMRVFYSAAAWTTAPGLGVYLAEAVSPLAAYLLSAATVAVLLTYFWYLRLTETIPPARPGRASPNPIVNFRRFFSQPRLALAWAIAVGRNAWWGMFFTFTPIYAIASGLGPEVGGVAVSAGSGFLFAMPLWARGLRRFGVRRTFTAALLASAAFTGGVAAFAGLPWLAFAMLMAAAMAMSVLDSGGNVLFLRAVRGRERPEMTPVYATYRDAAEIGPPAVFALLLKLFALPVVFVGSGVLMLGLARLARFIPRGL